MSAERRSPVRVKICGLTNQADTEAAIELGADALGFNCHPGSKRFIDLAENAAWLRRLPPFVARVAVMVSPSPLESEAVFGLPFIDAIQFHGDEEPAFCARFASRGLPFIKAIRLQDAASIAGAGDFHTRNVLVDAYVPGEFGGTGKLIDLDLAAEFARQHPDLILVLSGGLTPDNVAEAVARVRPFAVDVASGVESAPGRKDRSRMHAFIQAARGA